MRLKTLALAAVLAVGACFARASADTAPDPLPSWNDGAVKSAIVDFVGRVTKEGSPDFVPPEERVATFDNDGTLWAEQPAYFQLLFAIYRTNALSFQHPEWLNEEPYKAAVEGDLKGLGAQGAPAIMKIVGVTHAGMDTEEFSKIVFDWLQSARHPSTGRRYTEMVYQPMLELLAYLRANGFDTYIVSGGGQDFIRVFAEPVYGVPPENVIGSQGQLRFEAVGDTAVLNKLPEIAFIDDKDGKPIAIHRHIGRRPIAAFGNSDGDLEMLQWTAAGSGPSLCLLVHHTDAEREWAYDRDSPIGHLDKALDAANQRGWLVMDMAKDWATIFPSRAE